MLLKLENVIYGKGDVKGFSFTKRFENQIGYVYEVNTGDSVHFESFYKKQTPICLDFANRIYSETESKEIYPKSKDFGSWAWCSKDFNKCLNKINEA